MLIDGMILGDSCLGLACIYLLKKAVKPGNSKLIGYTVGNLRNREIHVRTFVACLIPLPKYGSRSSLLETGFNLAHVLRRNSLSWQDGGKVMGQWWEDEAVCFITLTGRKNWDQSRAHKAIPSDSLPPSRCLLPVL